MGTRVSSRCLPQLQERPPPPPSPRPVKPDVLRPGIAGIRGSMVLTLRPCTPVSREHPPSVVVPPWRFHVASTSFSPSVLHPPPNVHHTVRIISRLRLLENGEARENRASGVRSAHAAPPRSECDAVGREDGEQHNRDTSNATTVVVAVVTVVGGGSG